MNIFEYFEKSGKGFYLDEKRKSTWFNRADGSVIERPWDGSYWRTVNPSWYNIGWVPFFENWRSTPLLDIGVFFKPRRTIFSLPKHYLVY